MMMRLILLLLATLALAGCTTTVSSDEQAGAGSSSPQAVVESFLEDLNKALADPKLSEQTARRAWAELLASHFAPSERTDQRSAMSEMLDGFAQSTAAPAVGSKASLEITWSGITIIEQHDGRALVQVVDGVLTLRFLDKQGVLLRERKASLTEVLGQTSGGLPTLQVGGSWFMTEG